MLHRQLTGVDSSCKSRDSIESCTAHAVRPAHAVKPGAEGSQIWGDPEIQALQQHPGSITCRNTLVVAMLGPVRLLHEARLVICNMNVGLLDVFACLYACGSCLHICRVLQVPCAISVYDQFQVLFGLQVPAVGCTMTSMTTCTSCSEAGSASACTPHRRLPTCTQMGN